MRDPIVQAGDPVLRLKAKLVAHKDIPSLKLKRIVSRMRAILKKEEFGVALAAPHVGEPLRLFIVSGLAFDSASQEPSLRRDVHDPNSSAKAPASPDKVFINPELTRLSKKTAEMSEGCLSVRGKYGTVMRHEKATIKALDEKGKPFIYHGAGLIANIFQHECDHLDGVLYTDKAVKLEADGDLKSAREKLKEKHGV